MGDVLQLPDRSTAQRMAALRVGNDVRFYRAQIKREIKTGDRPVLPLLLAEPEVLDKRLHGMKVYVLIRCVPKLNTKRIDVAFSKAGVSPVKTLAGMTERQRFALVEALEDYPVFRRACA